MTNDLIPASKNQVQTHADRRLSRQVFDLCLIRVGAARNETISADVLNMWYAEALGIGFSDEAFKEAATAVVRSKPFGVTKFSEFCETVKLYTEEEVAALIFKAVNAKLESFGRLDKEALKVEAIEEMRIKVYREVDEFRERFRVDLQERVAAAQKWFLSASAGDQLEVAEMVKKIRPSFITDPLYRDHWKVMVRMCIADVIDEVEAYQKAVSG